MSKRIIKKKELMKSLLEETVTVIFPRKTLEDVRLMFGYWSYGIFNKCKPNEVPRGIRVLPRYLAGGIPVGLRYVNNEKSSLQNRTIVLEEVK
ncbi:MAG: hypothetical protein ABIA78_04155 [archaeon]